MTYGPTHADDDAFPSDRSGSPGLTKREHIATQMMAGLYANPHHEAVRAAHADLASLAVEATDALIDALNRHPSPRPGIPAEHTR